MRIDEVAQVRLNIQPMRQKEDGMTEEYIVERYKVSGAGDKLEEFSDYFNQESNLSWKLNPSKLRNILGERGWIWIVREKNSGQIIGTAALKHIEMFDKNIGEITFIMLSDGYRSAKFMKLLFRQIMKIAKRHDVVFITTHIRNKNMYRFMNRIPWIDEAFKVKTSMGSNIHNVWVFNKDNDADLETLRDYFAERIIQEY